MTYMTERIQNAAHLRDCLQYLLPWDWLQNYNCTPQHCTDMGSSRTHQIQNCCPMNNQKSFRIFCCFAQLHRETIAVHELVLASLIYSQKGTMEGLIGRLLLNPLTPIPPVTGRDECRHLFHSKLDLIYTRVLQEETFFAVIPRS